MGNNLSKTKVKQPLNSEKQPKDIWFTLEHLPEDGSDYRVNVERESPTTWNNIEIAGLAAQYFSPVTFGEVKEKVGGGSYKVTIWKDGSYLACQRVRIPGPPRIEKETLDLGTTPAPSTPPVPGGHSPAAPQDRTYETQIEIKHLLNQLVNQRTGNSNGKDSLDSLRTLTGLIQVLQASNDPSKLVGTITNAFNQGISLGKTTEGSETSPEVAIATELAKATPQFLETWKDIEKMKLDLYLKRPPAQPAQPRASVPARAGSPASAPAKGNADPGLEIKRILGLLKQAVAAKDDPAFWAAYMSRFINPKLLTQLTSGGMDKTINSFKKVDPDFTALVQNNFDWFSELFEGLKEELKEPTSEPPVKKSRVPKNPSRRSGNKKNR